MANHRSALKRIRQTKKRTERNRTHLSRLRHQVKKLRLAIDSKDKAAAEAMLIPTFSLIDHSIRLGILHRNTAARQKSRLSLRLKALS